MKQAAKEVYTSATTKAQGVNKSATEKLQLALIKEKEKVREDKEANAKTKEDALTAKRAAVEAKEREHSVAQKKWTEAKSNSQAIDKLQKVRREFMQLVHELPACGTKQWLEKLMQAIYSDNAKAIKVLFCFSSKAKESGIDTLLQNMR